jgi:hypothetical protein
MQDLWDTIKRPKKVLRQTKGIEILFSKKITVILLSLRNDMDIQIQEAFRTQNRHDQKIISPNHIIVKMSRI